MAVHVLEPWHHAFSLLSCAVRAKSHDWEGPVDSSQLRRRVKTLAVLLSIVPRSHEDQMSGIVEAWTTQFAGRQDVSLTELRQAAHTLLRRSIPESQSVAAGADRLRSLMEIPAGDSRSSKSKLHDSADARSACAACLEAWRTKLVTEPEWTRIPAVVPGTPAVPIEEAFVELYAAVRSSMDFQERFQDARLISARETGHSSLNATISVAAMVSRTLEACVVVGEPGSGKTTLVQWVAWSVAQGRFSDFDLALVVRLRDFAASVEENPETSLLHEFFQGSPDTAQHRLKPAATARNRGQLAGIIERVIAALRRDSSPDRDASVLAECLREASRRTHRVLLLLDGWDEVPTAQRAMVQKKISEEMPHFVVVITSRLSGLPWQLLPQEQGDFYEIAGLAIHTIRTFVANHLRLSGQETQTESLVDRLAADRDLRNMAANPFLLGLLVGVLSSPATQQGPITRTNLYQQIVAWMIESQRTKSPLTGAHLAVLERLSYLLLLSEDSARYVFRRRELDHLLVSADASPVIESRFITRLDPLQDLWSFLHATLAEFLAAVHLERLTDVEQRLDWQGLFWSPRRFPILEFLAGLSGGAATQLRSRAAAWLEQPDRFGLVLHRLVRLSLAGHWNQSHPAFVTKLLDRLWRVIASPDEFGFQKLLIQTFAALSPQELLARAAQLPSDGRRIWETICDVLPASEVRISSLYPLLPQHLQEPILLASRDHSMAESVQNVINRLDGELSSSEDWRQAVDAAGQVRHPAVAQRLLNRLVELPDGPLRDYGTMALARIFTALSAEVGIELLVTSNAVPPVLRRLASDRLSHGPNQGGGLDPVGRDTLLQHMACLPFEDTRLEPILAAFVGFPLRDGSELIAEIAGSKRLDPSVREMAIRVLHTVADRNVVALALSAIQTETSPLLFPAWLRLAVERRIALNRIWLEERIATEANSLTRRTLLTIYVRLWDELIPTDQVAWEKFLTDYLRPRLNGDRDDLECFELAAALTQASIRSGDRISSRIGDEITVAVSSLLRTRTDESFGRWKLVVQLLELRLDLQACHQLQQLLDALLAQMKTRRSAERLKWEAAALAAAEALAARDVVRLLDYGEECQPVQRALAELARESGCLVFPDRIIDADGREIANRSHPRGHGETPTAEDVQALLENLPASPRNALVGFWLLTEQRAGCDLGSTYDEVYDALNDVLEGSKYPALRRELHERYEGDLPDRGTWKRALSRAIELLGLLPTGVDFLNTLGLPRRRPSRRRGSHR